MRKVTFKENPKKIIQTLQKIEKIKSPQINNKKTQRHLSQKLENENQNENDFLQKTNQIDINTQALLTLSNAALNIKNLLSDFLINADTNKKKPFNIEDELETIKKKELNNSLNIYSLVGGNESDKNNNEPITKRKIDSEKEDKINEDNKNEKNKIKKGSASTEDLENNYKKLIIRKKCINNFLSSEKNLAKILKKKNNVDNSFHKNKSNNFHTIIQNYMKKAKNYEDKRQLNNSADKIQNLNDNKKPKLNLSNDIKGEKVVI